MGNYRESNQIEWQDLKRFKNGSETMLTARDIMTPEIVTVSPETDVSQAARLLLEKRINGIPVVDSNQRVVGILCQSDLIAQQKKISLPSLFTLFDGFISFSSSKNLDKEFKKIAAIKVSEAMTTDPVTVSPDTTVEEIATLMVNRGFHTVPVVDGDRLVGVIGKEDVLKTIIS
jgi:CBS domain-containing protein